MDNWETWRKEFLPRFEQVEQALGDLKAAGSKQFAVILTLLVSGFLALIFGLLYIILNHALL